MGMNIKNLRVHGLGTKVLMDSMGRRCRKQQACDIYKETAVYFSAQCINGQA